MSDLVDAICNVNNEDLDELIGELNNTVAELTRSLAVATAARDALAGKTGFGTFTVMPSEPCECAADVSVTVQPERKKPGRKPRQVAETVRVPRQSKRPIEATTQTLEVGKMLQRRGPMSKEKLADALGWRFHQVAMVIGRSARHFVHLDDGTIDVAPALAKLL